MSTLGPRAHRNLALLSGVAVLACLWLMHVPGTGAGLAYVSPGVFVFLLLWLGRYPGERMMSRFIQRSRRRRTNTVLAGTRQIVSPMPRGGGLLAAALAGRAPPPERAYPERAYLIRGLNAQPFLGLHTRCHASTC